MTELTFAELTALIGVNGLTVNDRYLITDKGWTIIAIATNAYRVVVPIVTEVTLSELEALVDNSALNEGLQYKVTDKGWLLTAISSELLTPTKGSIIFSGNYVIPSYIELMVFFVDSGIITRNLVSQPYTIQHLGYIATKIEIDNLGGEYGALVINGLNVRDEIMGPLSFLNITTDASLYNGSNADVSIVNNASPGVRIMTKFEKFGAFV